MAVTQKEIAQRLNISQAHVGRALSGKTTGRSAVSEETRQRIQAIAREMGYNPGSNREARVLIARRHGQLLKNGIIAVAFPQLKSPSPRTVPFFMSLLEGMEEEASSLGIDLCLCFMRPEELPRMIRERGVDGVVAIGLSENEMSEMRAYGVPIAVFNANYKEAHSVAPDDRAGTRMITQHLLELGHRNIAFLGVRGEQDDAAQGDFVEASALRLLGYKDALTEAGLPLRPEWIDKSLSLPQPSEDGLCLNCGGCAACQGWQALKDRNGIAVGGGIPFTAIVCHNDLVAMGLIRQAENDGLVVPGNLSVTGFDDVSSQYRFKPLVTSISSSNYEMGRSLVRLLHEDSQKPTDPEINRYEHCTFPVAMTVHESTMKLP